MSGTGATSQPRARWGPLIGLGVGAGVGALVGLADAIWAAARFARYDRGETLPALFYLHTAALDLALLAGLGLVCGLTCAVVPMALGPLALLERGRRFARLQGSEGARGAARAWATLITLGFSASATFWLSYHFATAYRNRLLAAMALVATLLPLFGAAWLVQTTLAYHLRRLGAWLARRSRLGAIAAGPKPWLAFVAVGAALAIYFGLRWAAPLGAALPWRAALLAGLGTAGIWLGNELLLRGRFRAWRWGALGLAMAGLVWVGLAYATFDNSAASRLVADAIERRAALAAHVLPLLARRHDHDRDGYAGWLGGGDCNDHHPDVHPAAVEIPDNGVDENCSGADLRRVDVPAVLRQRPRPASVGVPRRRYNIVVVVVDALRADRVGWAGYKRRLTPELDRLTARSVVFERAYTPSPRTSLALPALLTGLYPSELRRSGGYFMRVHSGNPSVATQFRRAGYVTLASVCHPYLRDRSGLRRGFDHWRVYSEPTKHEMNRVTTAKRVVDNAKALLTRHRQSTLAFEPPRPKQAPFFLFMYTMDPHTHYLRHPRLANYGRDLVDRYDAEIRYTDHHLGRLISDLKTHHQLDNTIIAVTADHGEAFGENGISFHGLWLYEHQVHVPWLLHVPKLGARRIKARVSLMDLAPTLFDLTGVKPPARIQGQSLRPWLPPKSPLPAPRVVYTELLGSIDNHLKRTIMLGRWKLVHQPHGNRYRLYDLQADPGERHNLMQRRLVKAREMKRLYEAYVATQLKIRPHGS